MRGLRIARAARAARAALAPRRLAAFALVVALVVALGHLAPPAHAHGASDAHLSLQRSPGGVAVRLDVALRDLDALVGLDADGDGALTAGELRAREAEVARAVLGAVAVGVPDRACTPGVPSHAVSRRADGAYAVLRIALDCGGPVDRVSVDYRLMAGVDATHRALLSAGDDARRLVLRPGDGPRDVPLAAEPGAGALHAIGAFFGEGLAHILDGIDHLAFVLALAVAAVARAAHEGRGLRTTALGLAGTVSWFTLAHSITLALVALHGLAPPARLVESVIAASVAYAGLEAFRAARGRARATPAALVFVFGLVHGFGFGAALAESGPTGRSMLAALLGFNLGVEAGQLLAVAAVFPLLWAWRARPLYRTRLEPAVAGAIVVAGLVWFVARALDLSPAIPWAQAAGG
ncbi:MAG: HupE/UreJ family protein [Burkholderiales bacterium]|nr:MAG: HupE/UreJ family protein [Burkholderiales bacterium]